MRSNPTQSTPRRDAEYAENTRAWQKHARCFFRPTAIPRALTCSSIFVPIRVLCVALPPHLAKRLQVRQFSTHEVSHWAVSLFFVIGLSMRGLSVSGPTQLAWVERVILHERAAPAPAATFFLRVAVVPSHALRPHKVGEGVTPSIAVTCAMRDKQSGAVQLESVAQPGSRGRRANELVLAGAKGENQNSCFRCHVYGIGSKKSLFFLSFFASHRRFPLFEGRPQPQE